MDGRDQQQLDAVSALTAFSSGGFSHSSRPPAPVDSRAEDSGRRYPHQEVAYRQPRPETNSRSSSASSDFGRHFHSRDQYPHYGRSNQYPEEEGRGVYETDPHYHQPGRATGSYNHPPMYEDHKPHSGYGGVDRGPFRSVKYQNIRHAPHDGGIPPRRSSSSGSYSNGEEMEGHYGSSRYNDVDSRERHLAESRIYRHSNGAGNEAEYFPSSGSTYLQQPEYSHSNRQSHAAYDDEELETTEDVHRYSRTFGRDEANGSHHQKHGVHANHFDGNRYYSDNDESQDSDDDDNSSSPVGHDVARPPPNEQSFRSTSPAEDEADEDIDESSQGDGVAENQGSVHEDTERNSRIETAAPAPAPVPRGKPEAMAKALASKKKTQSSKSSKKKSEKKSEKKPEKKSEPKKSPPKKSNSRKRTSLPLSVTISPALANSKRTELLLGEKAPPITDEEYANLEVLMTQFCRVPLLAEFSRPVSLLHPEISSLYSKIVSNPVDLGHVCRGIRRRQYKNCRDVRLDTWRVFANCVKYNSHPSNKEAVPSFVSIALHLREYFNYLWQEYMLPSDLPPQPAVSDRDTITAYEIKKKAFAKRDHDRRKRLENSGVLVLSKTFVNRLVSLLEEFLQNDGCVDALDEEPLFGDDLSEDREVDIVLERLREYKSQLEDLTAEDNECDYSMDACFSDLRKCYLEDIFDENPAMRNRFACRLERLFWKYMVPLHEANSRGVTQSSVWGNLAATVWARESSKKPFWPALCLGILPPTEQKEGWHQAVTDRNEIRLPEKLRSQLMIAKRRCEQAQKRQSLSYFLVEFLGTHEFIWVRETDIIENFDPNNDPNKNAKTGKKSRGRNSASSVVGSKTYQTALQECSWANEEYENVLQDVFEFTGEDEDEEEDDEEEMNYSFPVLAQSDDEIEEADKVGYSHSEKNLDVSEVDEANWLLSHDGLLDTSAEGRKNAKKRTQAMKKATQVKEEAEKKKRSKSKEKKEPPPKKEIVKKEASKKDMHKKQQDMKTDLKEKEKKEKKDLRDLEKRRRKRMRERERVLRNEARKKTKRRRSASSVCEENERGLVLDKRSRATAIVNAYLTRLSNQDEGKSLALSGVMTMPAATVDSTGLLGMSLAFRAACGELKMPDDGKELPAKFQPWTVFDTETPLSTSERIKNLEKQIECLQKEIFHSRRDAEKRKFLAAEYGPRRLSRELAAEADEKSARINHFKKKRKLTPAKSENDGNEPARKKSKTTHSADENNDKRETNVLGDDNSSDSDHAESVDHDESSHDG